MAIAMTFDQYAAAYRDAKTITAQDAAMVALGEAKMRLTQMASPIFYQRFYVEMQPLGLCDTGEHDAYVAAQSTLDLD
jgi:hypothetical protein